ncbi:carboxymuconolactone decarboxylase family protein [Rhodopila sp.]|jgi:4-carboxymuconolactone decarboxylase|uniref:carboxymuconolactone decarboxylase family protein n=1 Tax=Rhodopila sp. TaxID=2480087 RepID=UPI002C316FE2|nr:hypothetical protein [Rhodopila sp.]HVZ10727.1 hypothetical protein [Rhodopila sp.]
MARLPLIHRKEQLAPQHQPIADAIIGSRGSLEGPFSVFLHCPELAGRLAHLGSYIRFEGTLDFRVRTLAALVVAREFDAQYVWGAQTGVARQRGITDSTVAAIKAGTDDGIPPEDLAIVAFTRTLLRRHRVADADAAVLRDRFGDDGFIQLTGAIGYYSLLAMTVNAAELESGLNADVL